jgi:hypothetical protein
MNNFDPVNQEHYNGPLSRQLRERLQRFRTDNNATLQDIGNELGLTGSFVGKLLDSKSPANISTKHVARIVQKVEHAEIELGWAPKKGNQTPPKNVPPGLASLMREITRLGYDVSVTLRV